MEQFDRVCLAFCFGQFHVGRFEILANHVRLNSGISNSSCQFVVYLQALLQLKPHLNEQFFLDKFTLTRKNCSCRWRIVGRFSLSR